MSDTLNYYPGYSPSVAITSGTSLVIAVAFTLRGDGAAPTAATLNAVSGTLEGATNYTGGDESNIGMFSFTTIPSAGNYTLAITASGTEQCIVAVYEFDNRSGVVASSFRSQDFGNQTSPYTANYNLSSSSGNPSLVCAAGADDNTSNTAALPVMSANLSEISDVNRVDRLQCATGVDADVAGDPELYTFTFEDNDMGGGSQGRITAASILLVDSVTTLTADSITAGTILAGDTVTIQLSNATNATGKTLSTPQGSITPTAQDISSISFLAPDLKTFGDKTGDYDTNIAITVTDGAESDAISFQVSPDSGDEVGAITAVEGIYSEAAFSGVAVTDLYYTATISGADFTVGAVPVLGTEQVFNLWIQDQTDGVWGDPFVVTIPASATVALVDIVIRDVLRSVTSNVTKSIFEV